MSKASERAAWTRVVESDALYVNDKQRVNPLTFTVPLVPPTANHYKVRYRNGNTVVAPGAIGFKQEVARHAGSRCVAGRTFHVTIHIVLGYGNRGDIDNYAKLVMDGLADAGVFVDIKGKRKSDAWVRGLMMILDTDTRPKSGGYTTIEVQAL